MKTSHDNHGARSTRLGRGAINPQRSFCVLILILLGWPGVLQAQIDNFNDGNDTGWTRYDPIGSFLGSSFATFAFPSGGYRISTPASPAPGTVGPARAGSFREDVTYTDFYITVDVVNWNASLDQAFGIVARATDIGPGSTDGYAFAYAAGDRAIVITGFTNENPTGGQVGSSPVTLTSGNTYRFVFSGSGSQLSGGVYQLPDTSVPLATVTGTNTDYSSGVAGLIAFDFSTGRTGTTDVTYDNYLAIEVEPPTLTITLLPFSQVAVTWPAPATRFNLEKASSPTATVWDAVPAAEISLVDGFFTYIEDAAPGTTFFRLRRQ